MDKSSIQQGVPPLRLAGDARVNADVGGSMTDMNYKMLFDRIHSCPGAKYYQLLLSHDTSQAIFAGNYRELKNVLDVIHDPAKSLPLFSTENRNELHLVQTDIVRLFHNYVASALTLVEHTRNLMRDDAVKEIYRKEYQAKVDETFVNDLLSGFVQDLRNYFLHRGLPSTGMQLNWTKESQQIDTRFFLDVEKMKDWDGWRSRSKKYLAEAKGKTALLEVIENYTAKVREFHRWFSEWFLSLHKTELGELRTLQEKWNRGIDAANEGLEGTGDPLCGSPAPQP